MLNQKIFSRKAYIWDGLLREDQQRPRGMALSPVTSIALGGNESIDLSLVTTPKTRFLFH
jgi:hypothetical protein